MATCSAYAINYFLQVSDGNTVLSKNTTIHGDYPFRPSFAASATYNLEGTYITTDSNNTLIYKGNSYSYYNGQLCTPTVHVVGSSKTTTGRAIMTNTPAPVAELLLTFVNPTLVNTPTVVILILPIYMNQQQSGGDLLSDLLTTPNGVVSSFNSLFSDTDMLGSYGYNACISTVDSSGAAGVINNSISTYILSFPTGYTTSATMPTSLPDYVFYPANSYPIVTSFTVTDITYTPSTFDPSTFYSMQKTSSDPIVLENVIHYMKSPYDIIGAPSALLTLDQYKCYPFSELRNLQDNPGGAAKYVVPMGNAVNALENPGMGWSVSGVGYAILSILAIMAGIALIYVLIQYFATQDDVPVEQAAALAAAVPNPFD